MCVFNLSLCIYIYIQRWYIYTAYIYIYHVYSLYIYIYTPETIVKIVQTLPKPEAPAPAPVVWSGTTITEAVRCALTTHPAATCGWVPLQNKWDAGSRCLRWPVSKHAPQENHRQTIGKTSWENDGKWWYNYNQQTFEMQLKAHSSSDFYGIVYVYS